MSAQARMISTKSNMMSQEREITKTLKKNMLPNPTHLPVHCGESERSDGGHEGKTGINKGGKETK